MSSRKLPLSTVFTALGFLAACSGNDPSGGGFTTGGQTNISGSGSGVAGSATAGTGAMSAGSGGMPAASGSSSGGTEPGGAAGMAGQPPSSGSNAGGSSSGGTGGGSSGGAGGSSGFPDPSTFTCNGMLGVSVNGDWFAAGFETVVDNAKWQLRWKTQSFVEQWADPNNAVWNEPLVSACANGSTNPDRVLFTGVNWTYTTAAEWVTQLTAVIENIKTKYTAVKEVDLMTMLRAPGNKVCGDPAVAATKEQVTAPFLDEAIMTVAAKYPTLVRIAPPFYAPSCDVFLPNSPHYAAGKAAAVSKVFSDYYVNH